MRRHLENFEFLETLSTTKQKPKSILIVEIHPQKPKNRKTGKTREPKAHITHEPKAFRDRENEEARKRDHEPKAFVTEKTMRLERRQNRKLAFSHSQHSESRKHT
jgi:hypothetical protein